MPEQQKSQKPKKYVGHIISHTHWDREWYLSFEQFRIRLLTLIDHLLEILDQASGYEYFMLDGQTIVLNDYLEVKPENESRLKEYIKKGTILIGPWYVLSDEFLVSGESLIRNLLLGDRMCIRFMGKMNEGYLPDSFGHVAQIPQILQGFGIASAIFWRGVGSEVKTTEFVWQAPDGSEVLAIHMPFGYCAAASLPVNDEDCLGRIRNLVDEISPLSTTNVLLLMNGCDHLEAQPDLPGILQKLNAKMGNVSLIHSNLPKFVQEIREKSAVLPQFTGEWRSGERAGILGGTLSTRMYLKQANHRVETLLEKWVEPFSSFSWLIGSSYPLEMIWQAWKYLLQNQAHDSIGGCSLDEVDEEVMTRFAKAGQIGEELCDQALSFLGEKIDTSGEKLALVVFNSLPHKRTEAIDVAVDLDEMALPRETSGKAERKKNPQGPVKLRNLPTQIKVYGGEDRTVISSLNKVEKALKMVLNPYNRPQVHSVNRCHVTILAQDIPGLGYKVYFLDPDYSENLKIQEKPAELLLENEYFKVTPGENGSLSILDKKTGTLYDGANTFSDGGDAGDSYTYSPPLRDWAITSSSKKTHISWQEYSSIGSTLKIETCLPLPIGLTEDRKERSKETVECPITSYISLSKGVRRVDIKTEVENRARDHRLRVLFPFEAEVDYCYSEGHFHLTPRSVKLPQVKIWAKEQVSTSPQKSFIDISDGQIGLAVANRGLPEYEVIKEDSRTTIALTLLRCVGYMSLDNLLTRKHHAGWPLPLPGAQCLGKHTFYYSIIPHPGGWKKVRICREAHNFNTPLRSLQIGIHKGKLSRELSFIQIEPDGLMLSTIKRAEEGKKIIVRLYNTSADHLEGRLSSLFPLIKAQTVQLNEEPKDELQIKDQHSIQFEVRPWQIVTLALFV